MISATTAREIARHSPEWNRDELARAIQANVRQGDRFYLIFFLLLYQRRVHKGLP